MTTILLKISRRQFCKELEGKNVELIAAIHDVKYREKNLEILDSEDRDIPPIPAHVGKFTAKSNGFVRGKSAHYWEKGDTCYKFGDLYIIYEENISMYYREA